VTSSADPVTAGIVSSVLTAPPTLGDGRLLCVDGPAGSGKTTLGDAILSSVERLGLHAQLLHMDDMFAGWAGLDEGMRMVATDVVAPLRRGAAGRFRRYDWHLEAYAEEHVVEPCDVLVIEGVGAGNAAYAEAVTCLVWVEAPPVVRLERGVARDGEHMRPHWLAWRQQEDALFARERTRERADVIVDGTR
jgi:uridine kinase